MKRHAFAGLTVVLACALGGILFALSCSPSEGGGGTPPPSGGGGGGGGVTWSLSPSADRTTIIADGSDYCTMTITLKSSSGTNVTDGTIINFSTSSGTLTNPSTLQSGTSVTAVTSGGQVIVRLQSISSSTDVNATVTMSVPGSGLVSTTLTIKFSGVSVGAGGWSFTVTSTPTSLTVRGTSTITATLYNTSTGAPAPDGTVVVFTATTGILTPTSRGTLNGAAAVTFTAGSVAGTVTILVSTSSLGGVSGSGTFSILPASAGSIVFVSATPTQLGVKGTLQQEVSNIIFEVRDPYNNLVADNTRVDFNLPIILGGGEFISPSVATTTNGQVTVQFHSGSKSGVVYIVATTTGAGGPITSASTLVTILGGPPSGAHFSLAVETGKCNMRGRIESGLTAQLTARVGDRFGNPVKSGTPVWFGNVCGLIGKSGSTASAITNDQGEATAIFTTQGNTQAVDLTNGWCMLTAYVVGEEGFLDNNGNGRYDAGEPFTNATNIKGETVNFDLPDPFVDVYGSLMTGSAYYMPGDTFWDINGLSYQSRNDVWDPRTYVWDWNLIILSGAGFVTISPTTFNLTCSNPSQGFFIIVDDYWGNPLEPTTSIKASTNATAAKLMTTLDITKLGCAWPGWGGTWFTTTLSATGNKFEANKDVTVEVNSPNIYSSPIKVSATGNINPPVAALSSIVANPLYVVADGKTTSDIIASVVDSCGTPVEGANVTFTKTETGSIPGSAVFDKGSGATGANGTITVKLSDSEQEQVTVQARVEGTLIPSSAIVSFSSPTISIYSVPTVVSSNGATAAYITVTVRSATGVPLAGVAVVLTQAEIGGSIPFSAYLAANSGTTDSNGRFSTTLTDTEPESVTITAQYLAIQNSTTATFSQPNPANSSVTANPSTIFVGISSTTITVSVRNTSNQPIAGSSVVLTASAGGVLASSGGLTNANGTFATTMTAASLGTITVSGTADGVSIGSTQVTVVTSPPSSTYSSVTANPATIYKGGGITGTTTITARVRDASNFPIVGANVVLSASGGGVLASPSGTTNASGIYATTMTSTTTGIVTVSGTADSVSIGSADVTVNP